MGEIADNFGKLQTALLRELKSSYKRRLVAVAVYGSAARGTQRADSDLDFIVIADGLPRGRTKRMAEFEAVENALAPGLLRYKRRGFDVSLSPIIKTPQEALAGSPLFLDMVDDARILYDRDGFFSGVLDGLRRRLRELGAKKIVRGNAWYWDLKPDFRPGEVFEI